VNLSNRLAAGGFALGLMVFGATACSSSDKDSTPTSSSSSSATSSPATSSASTTHQAPAPVTTTHNNPAPQTTTPVRDDDPGGKPCTDQSGAPGHYIWSDSSNQWVCEITGDAPR